ncbi:MAG TPA: DNA polymerase Y family protein, partial [Ferruginibacter sp.]|nr:DNA polymerase Y family protein [Ferruginibacter sp.]
MQQRFVSIWFRHLKTDWFIRRQSALKDIPFVLAAPDHGRMLITASNTAAENEGVYPGMVVADARAVISSLQVLDDIPGLSTKLLTGIGEWCIRFAPAVAIDEPNGLLLEVTGCAHLWGDEKDYLTDIYKRIRQFGYDIKIGIADTIGAAWAIARFGKGSPIVESGQQSKALLSLPAAALRIEPVIAERLEKLGLRQVKDFIHLPRPSLRRRFGQVLLQRINQALGYEEEWITPLQTIEPYQERLPCLEPIVTATGIEIAIQRMLDVLCKRLQQEGKGLRIALLKGYRVDGKVVSIEIGTNRPSCNTKHLFKLFEIKIDSIEPALGIELFTMNALKVEDVSVTQEKLWEQHGGLDDIELSELLDRIEGKMGSNHIHRYVPAEHYWPER